MVLLEVKFIWTEEGICGTSCLTMSQNLVVTILLLFFFFGLPTDTGSISGFGRAGWKSCCILMKGSRPIALPLQQAHSVTDEVSDGY